MVIDPHLVFSRTSRQVIGFTHEPHSTIPNPPDALAQAELDDFVER
jgi:hypothetical protein